MPPYFVSTAYCTAATSTNQNSYTNQTAQAYPTNISLRIEIPDPIFAPTIHGTIVEIPSCQNQTLSKTVIVGLPPGMEVASYDYKIGENRTFRFVQPLLSRQPEPLNQGNVSTFKYATVSPSQRLLQVLPHSFLRCYEIASIDFHPLIPSKDLNEITLVKSLYINLLLRESAVKTIPATNDDLVDPIAADIICNYKEACEWKAYPILSVNSSMPLSVADTGTYDYIVVTHNKFLDYAERLAAWKNQRGVRTKVTTIQAIINQFAGRDNATKIREYVKQAFNEYHFKYLLLFGDVDYVPTRYIFNPDTRKILDRICDLSLLGHSKPTDLYYADLDVLNDWYDPVYKDYGRSSRNSSSRQDLFGWTPDIIAGRIPVNTVQEANVTVTKQIKYEQSRIPGEWSRKILLVGARISEVFCASEFCEDILTLAPQSAIVKKYYYEYRNLLSFKKDFNQGSAIIYSGSHGCPTMLAQSDLEILALPLLGIGGFFDSQEAYHNVSNSYSLPVWFSQSCLSAAFDYREKAGPLEWLQYGFSDCIGEALLHNPRGGAIAYIGAARVTYGSEEIVNDFFKYFFDSKKGDFSPGLSLYYARLQMSSLYIHSTGETGRKIFSTYHLLGDPEFKTRTTSSVSQSLSRPTMTIGKSVTVSGSITPAHDNTLVKLAYIRPNGSNVSQEARTTSTGLYGGSFSPDVAGNWNVETSWDGDIDHEGASSQSTSFTVLAILTVQTPYSGIVVSVDDISHASDSNGRIQMDVSAGPHAVGVQSLIQTSASSRHLFTGWSDGATSNPRDIMVETNSILAANYKTQFYLTLNASPAGLVSIPGEGWCDSGASVHLYAPEVQGYSFTHWLIGTSTVSANPTDIIMDSPSTVTACYQKIENQTPPPSSSPTPTPSSTPTATPQPRQGCIIATAAYGSEMAPEVAYMRHVRDDMVGSNEVGRQIVNEWNIFYYSWSPPVAQFIGSCDASKSIFQVVLLPLVGIVHVTAIVYDASAPFNLGFASAVAFLYAAISSITIYLSAPLLVLRFICGKRFSIRLD